MPHLIELDQFIGRRYLVTTHGPLAPGVPIPAHDRRFRAPAWRTSPFHALLVQAYLIHADYLNALAAIAALAAAGLTPRRIITRRAIENASP